MSLKSGNMIKNKKNLPYGFDSVYIMRSEDEEDSKLYKHDYILFDNTQVRCQREKLSALFVGPSCVHCAV